jgi:hypothetical protein
VTGSGPELLSVSNSPKGNILNDAFAAAANSTSEVTVDSSDGLSVTGSTFSATLLVVTNTNGATITGNTFNLEDFVGFAAGISITGGTGSSIENNSITDIGTPVTVSDGIFARSIGNAAIEGNTVKNVTNCGVETAGLITNVQISNNGITNAGTCGIGAWEDSSWQNNTVASNTATNVPLLFDFFRLDGLETGESAVYFENNNFTNNKLVSQPVLPQTPAWVVMNSTGNNVPSGDFVLGNNVFTGNNFLATGLLPTFVPTSMIVDGGGNICNAAAATNAFPLVCGGSGSPNPPPGPDTQAPTVPTLISAIAVSPTQVNLIWSQSTDNVGVAGYQITRNGLVLTSVTGATTLTYSDTTVLNYTPYTYSVKAFDAAKNYSNASNSIQVTTPRR